VSRASYALTKSAAADLREIVTYTRAEWGDAQSRTCAAKLKRGVGQLARGKGVYKDLSALHQGLRVALCEHHYIFCLPRADSPALVVAILHERMDVLARLKSRLR
jgi:toxin ParE1/3/4